MVPVGKFKIGDFLAKKCKKWPFLPKIQFFESFCLITSIFVILTAVGPLRKWKFDTLNISKATRKNISGYRSTDPFFLEKKRVGRSVGRENFFFMKFFLHILNLFLLKYQHDVTAPIKILRI